MALQEELTIQAEAEEIQDHLTDLPLPETGLSIEVLQEAGLLSTEALPEVRREDHQEEVRQEEEVNFKQVT